MNVVTARSLNCLHDYCLNHRSYNIIIIFHVPLGKAKYLITSTFESTAIAKRFYQCIQIGSRIGQDYYEGIVGYIEIMVLKLSIRV